MAFWVSLIYRGAHACGLREERSIALESKGLYFPKEYPDTVAGEKYIESDRKYNEESYNRQVRFQCVPLVYLDVMLLPYLYLMFE